jgi:dynein assembly factor with WDR repeat domains 1
MLINRFVTGSYDRRAKMWDLNGKELQNFEGHENVVYSLCFNYPFCDKLLTGSFDKTAKVILFK